MNKAVPSLDDLMAADDRRLFLLRTKKMILESRDNILTFAKYLRPNPMNLGNPFDSVYTVEPHHAFIADRLEALERGEIKRLILSVPPRHGKSELASKTFIPWVVGRNPHWSTIMARDRGSQPMLDGSRAGPSAAGRCRSSESPDRPSILADQSLYSQASCRTSM